MSTAVLDTPKNNTVSAALRAATERVEKIKNDAPQHFPEAASIGDAVRQGDVYIQLVPPATSQPVLHRRDPDPQFPLQLAPGNTKGSRHCLEHGDGVTVYQPVKPNSREMFEDLAVQHGIDPKTITGSVQALAGEIRKAQWQRQRTSGPAGRANNSIDFMSDRATIEMLEFAGPILVLEKTNTIVHPEHGNWILPPGTYRVTYQRTVTRENTIARVLD